MSCAALRLIAVKVDTVIIILNTAWALALARHGCPWPASRLGLRAEGAYTVRLRAVCAVRLRAVCDCEP